MKLSGKTRAEIDALLRDRSRDELIGLIFSLVTFEKLLTAREIAEASRKSKRDVLEAMRAGRFADRIFGPGFFCMGGNSLKVTASAANAWRASFFVPVVPRHPIAAHKKNTFPSLLQSAEDERRAAASETDLNGKESGQKVVRDLSVGYLETASK